MGHALTDWSNKTLVLTGATGKLGALMLQVLLAQGSHVIASYNRARSATELPQHKHLDWLHLDLLDAQSRETFCLALQKRNVHWLIHNARSLESLKVDAEGWAGATDMQAELAMAVTGPYDLTRRLSADHPLEQILFINSIYGLVTPNIRLYPTQAKAPGTQYGVAKAAQLHLVKELAVRLSHKNIRVNALVLGGVQGRAPADFVARYSQLCPQQRMLQDEDVQSAVLMALNPQLTSVTGHHFVMDGGWTLW
jgi:NAD(P)-dependent dehydrogenase (short-subunit alcohol dehydrogenase family)